MALFGETLSSLPAAALPLATADLIYLVQSPGNARKGTVADVLALAGNVVGPASTIDGEIMVADGTSGTKIKGSGTLVAALQPLLANLDDVEIGTNLTGDRNALIDFHSSDAQPDSSARVIRSPGLNGKFSLYNFGTGAVTIGNTASDFFSVDASGGVEVGTPVGGSPGAGKINATDYQIAGVSVASSLGIKAPLVGVLTGNVPANSNPGQFLGYALNLWNITDNATVGASPDPSNQAFGILVDYTCGGPTLQGTRNAMTVMATLTAPSENAVGQEQNYCAVQMITTANTGDNGTNTGAGAKGAVFAMNPVVQIDGTAQNLLHMSCAEWNCGATAGTSVRYKSFTNFANYPNDAVKGAEVDTIFWFYKQGASAVGFDHGFLFSNNVGGTSGLQLLATTGTIMAAQGAGTCATGFDFSDWNFTTAVMTSKGFQITGTGSLFAHEGHFLGASGAGGIIYGVTPTLPTAQGNVLGDVRFGFQNQTTFVDELGAYIRAIANAAWTEGTSQPTLLQFFATASGSATPTEQMRLSPDSATVAKTTPMFLYIGGLGLRQVTVGADGSGGAGFSQLIVPTT